MTPKFLLKVFLFSAVVSASFFVYSFVHAAEESHPYGPFQCGEHGTNVWCYGQNLYLPSDYQTYEVNNIAYYGHRHGGSHIIALTCLAGNDGVSGSCYQFEGRGDELGHEYGNSTPHDDLEHPWNGLDVGGSLSETNSPGVGGYYVYTRAFVDDAEVQLFGTAYAFKPDPPPPPEPPTAPPGQTNLPFVITSSCGGGITGANVTISGGATGSGSTDGSGYINFVVGQNTAIGWSVTATGYPSQSGSVTTGTADPNPAVTISITPTAGCGTTPPPPSACGDNASVAIVTALPANMTPGTIYPFSVRVTNTGSKTWSYGESPGWQFRQISAFNIVSTTPLAGYNHGHLPDIMAPGASVVWGFNFTAPSTSGALNMQMYYGGVPATGCPVGYFGPQFSTNFTVASATANNAQYISQIVPTTVNVNQSFEVSITMLNTGTTTWTDAAFYRLGSQNEQDNLTWGLNRAGTSGTVAPGGRRTFTFTAIAPSTPGTRNFQWRMVTDFCPGCEWFGDLTLNVAINVVAIPNPPSNLTLNNTNCGRIVLNWTDNSNNESGFRIYRGTSSGSLSLLASVGAGIQTFNDTPTPAGAVYYYQVSAYTSSPVTESARSNEQSAYNNPCNANFSNSTKLISRVNGSAYNGNTVIKNGDTITYQITLINAGPANATVNYLCEYPSSNLTNLRNLTVTGTGSVNGGITPNSTSCSSNYRLNVTGTKNVANNWIITFDATLSTGILTLQEVLTNYAVLNYTDSSNKTHTISSPSLIVNTSAGRPPNWQEAAP